MASALVPRRAAPAVGPASTGDDGDPRRAVVLTALVAAAFVALVAWSWFGVAATVPDRPGPRGETLSAVYDPPTRPVEAALNARDGQVFATVAVDPAVRRPELIRGGPGEQAYRYQRPLLGWVGWAASGGQAALAPWSLVVACALSVVALVAVAAATIARLGGPPLAALVLLVTPGVLADITFVGPEALGTALLLVGLGAWRRGDRRAALAAVAAFAAAGLCRETLLLVPAALAAREVWAGRYRPAGALAASAAPYLAWVLALRVVVGSWPVGTVDGRLSPVPFAGMASQVGGWPPGEAAAIALTLGLGVAGLVWGRDPLLRTAVAAQLPLVVLMGGPVWGRSADVGRVLLPFAALGLVALAGRGSGRPGRGPGRAPAAHPDHPSAVFVERLEALGHGGPLPLGGGRELGLAHPLGGAAGLLVGGRDGGHRGVGTGRGDGGGYRRS